jgi:hypothetical protein
MQKNKIVLLARDCDSSAIVYNYLSKHFEIDSVIIEKAISKTVQFRKRIKRIGFFKAAGQVVFMLTVFPVLKWLSEKRKEEIFKKFDLHTSPHFNGKEKHVNSLNSDEARNLLKQLNPDLVLVNGTRIISGKTLKAVQAPFINIHTGITPAFRGVHGGYWAIATGRKELFGTTIHYVDTGVDTGGIIEQVFTDTTSKDNFFTYPYLQYAVALPVLKNVVQSYEDGIPPRGKAPVVTDSKLWYHPTIFQWLFNLGKTSVFIFPLSYFLV